MATNAENSNVANATTGTATIIGFRYVKDWCIITLDNGVTGILGKKDSMPLPTMLALKGQRFNFEYSGEFNGHPRYNLGFAL